MVPDEYRKMFSAEDVHWWYVSLHELILAAVRLEHRRKGPLVMLDAGCGTGRLLQILSDHGTAQGCDASEAALERCRCRGLKDITKADITTADFGNERFDIVASIDVLCHRQVVDEGTAIRSLHRSLKQDGILILQVPAYEWLRSEHDRAVHTKRRYVLPVVRSMLENAGFRVDKITYRVGLLFPAIAAVRLLQRLGRSRSTSAAAVSDIRAHTTLTNALLVHIMRYENRLLEHVSLPFGSSIFAVARKVSGAAER